MVQKILKMCICAVIILPLCGCNVMVLSQHLKIYAKAVEYRYVSQEIVHRIKGSVTDRIVLDQAKTLYASLISNGRIFIDTMQREAKDNSLDSDIYDQFTALTQAFDELKEFVPDTVNHAGANAAVSLDMTTCELEAQRKGKAAANAVKAVIGDKTRSREERIAAAVMLIDQDRWPLWEKI